MSEAVSEQTQVSVPKIPGVEKAALLLLTLGEDVAAQILTHMNPKQVQVVGATMSTMDNITRPMVESVLNDFLECGRSNINDLSCIEYRI